MELNEIRIGNIFMMDNYQHTMDYDDYMILAVNADIPINGIPLTEEWLLRFGFYFKYSGDHLNYIMALKNDMEFRVTKFDRNAEGNFDNTQCHFAIPNLFQILILSLFQRLSWLRLTVPFQFPFAVVQAL